MKSNSNFIKFATKLLHLFPPETAHDIALSLLKLPIQIKDSSKNIARLKTNVSNIGQLPHPIGLAAGFDKNATHIKELSDLGFSFLEFGTITPKPQIGNPKPRLFRLKNDLALINKMGFNNQGADKIYERIKKLNWHKTPIGINIGKNKNTVLKKAIFDYIYCIEKFFNISKYIVINISSPNTPGLRDLSNKEFILELSKQVNKYIKNIWIKLDPDIDRNKFQSIIEVIADQNFAGVILTNTHKVDYPFKGGLSGHPLSIISSSLLEWAWEVHKGKIPMIASGGILSAQDIWQKMIRGASAVQIYTAFIYNGPAIINKLKIDLLNILISKKIDNIENIIGSYWRS